MDFKIKTEKFFTISSRVYEHKVLEIGCDITETYTGDL